MKHAIFREEPFRGPDKYGLYRVSKETETRYHFEHHAGEELAISVFGYHRGRWLTKDKCRLHVIAWIDGVASYCAIVEAHRDKEEALAVINLRAHDDREEVVQRWLTDIIDMGAGAP